MSFLSTRKKTKTQYTLCAPSQWRSNTCRILQRQATGSSSENAREHPGQRGTRTGSVSGEEHAALAARRLSLSLCSLSSSRPDCGPSSLPSLLAATSFIYPALPSLPRIPCFPLFLSHPLSPAFPLGTCSSNYRCPSPFTERARCCFLRVADQFGGLRVVF